MIDTTTLVLILVAVAVAVLLAYLIFGRKQRVALSDKPVEPLERRTFAPAAPKAAIVPPPVPAVEEGHGVADEVAAAVEDVVGQFIGIDVHHDTALDTAARRPADMLTTIKGLGPKAESQLNALGISRYEHLAALDDAAIAALDAQMGNFRGRIVRDKWVEQAALLAADDTAGFEARFGKIG